MGSAWTGDTGLWLSSSITQTVHYISGGWKPGKHGGKVTYYGGKGGVYTSYGETYGPAGYGNDRDSSCANVGGSIVKVGSTKKNKHERASDFKDRDEVKALAEEEENEWIEAMKGESE